MRTTLYALLDVVIIIVVRRNVFGFCFYVIMVLGSIFCIGFIVRILRIRYSSCICDFFYPIRIVSAIICVI